MNFLLQFKDKKHAEAYSHDHQLQVNKRLAMVVTWTVLNLLASLVLFLLYGIANFTPLDNAKLSLQIVSIITLIVVKCKFQRAQKYIRIINFVLDIFLIFVIFIFYPLLGADPVNIFGKLGIFVIAWCTCLATYSIYYFVMSWWIRAFIPVLQIGFYLVFVVEREPFSSIVITFAVECISIYLLYIYIHERYQRLDFLEKRRVYENYEAIKKIFDDIIQGVLLVDRSYNIIYSNQTVYALLNCQQNQFRQEGPSLRELFSQVYVKTLLPRMELTAADGMRTTLESDEEVSKS